MQVLLVLLLSGGRLHLNHGAAVIIEVIAGGPDYAHLTLLEGILRLCDLVRLGINIGLSILLVIVVALLLIVLSMDVHNGLVVALSHGGGTGPGAVPSG